MKRRLLLLAAVLVLAGTNAGAQTYSTCPGTGSPTSCTMSFLVTNVSTPIFDQFNTRNYLLIQNLGYVNLVQTAFPVCCAIGTKNHAVWDATHNCNGVMLFPNGQNYEPTQFTAPQSAFRVPARDVACISPLGNQTVTGLQE